MCDSIILQSIASHQKVIDLVKSSMVEQIKIIADVCRESIKNGNKLLFCGNGGSAADSQHLSAEFVGRFKLERKGMPAIALTTDTSILTSIGNDYGFEQIFSRQVEALGNAGDVLIGLSTSGNSKNILLAVEKARQLGLRTITFTGCDGGKLKNISDICLNIPEQNTARVQEAHILIGHIICELSDDACNE